MNECNYGESVVQLRGTMAYELDKNGKAMTLNSGSHYQDD